MSIFGPPNINNMEKKKDIKGLIKALEYKKGYWIRKPAAEALGRIGDKNAVEPLIKVLDDAVETVREAAVQALVSLNDSRAFDPLIKLMDDKESSIRKIVAEYLGKSGDTRAIEVLIKALNDKLSDIRQIAAKSLSEIGDTRAVEPLVKTLKKGSIKDKIFIAYALTKLGKDHVAIIIDALKDKSVDSVLHAVYILGQLGDNRAIEPLINLLVKDKQIRHAAASALDKLGDSKWKKIVKDDFNETIINLGKTKDPRAMEPLVEALRDYYSMSVPAEALGELGDPRAVEPLIMALGDTLDHVRKDAAEALAKLGEPKWKEWVKGDENDLKRLGESGDTRVIEPLIKFLNASLSASHISNLVEKRKFAINSLENFIDERSVKPLIQALSDTDKNVRITAVKVLINIAKKKPFWLKDNWLDIKEIVGTKHVDEERYNAPNCTISYHADEGIGMSFPDKPKNLDF